MKAKGFGLMSAHREHTRLSGDELIELGIQYFCGEGGVKQDYAAAVKFFEMAAEQGQVKAQCQLGVCYKRGYGVEQNYGKAVKYYQMAASQGHVRAQHNLGVCYKRGLGVEQDFSKAAKYYKMAADGGYLHAQFNLGVCYCQGCGVDQDFERAVWYYQMAADQGHVIAQYDLAICYERGCGVKQDYFIANKYYQMAASQGHVKAKKRSKICLEKIKSIKIVNITSASLKKNHTLQQEEQEEDTIMEVKRDKIAKQGWFTYNTQSISLQMEQQELNELTEGIVQEMMEQKHTDSHEGKKMDSGKNNCLDEQIEKEPPFLARTKKRKSLDNTYSASTNRRVAFVVGSTSSKTPKFQTLHQPIKDAEEMSTLLEKLDFEVYTCLKPNRDHMIVSFRQFVNKCKQQSDMKEIVVYFSGHGIEGGEKRDNCLISEDGGYVSLNGWISELNDYFDESVLVIFILDMCRSSMNNPTFRPRPQPKGAFPIKPLPEMAIVYACDPGTQSWTFPDQPTSVFTKHLISCIKESNEGDHWLAIVSHAHDRLKTELKCQDIQQRANFELMGMSSGLLNFSWKTKPAKEQD